MTILIESEINEVLEHRVSNIAQFGPITRGYLDKLILVHTHMLGVLTASLDKPIPKLTVEKLNELRVEVEKRFALAKDHLRHWEIQFSSMNEDLELLSGELDDKAVNLRREVLVKQLMLMKKRADDLKRKKQDIEDINAEIHRFANSATITLTDEEMDDVFGDDKESVKNMRGVSYSRERREVEEQEEGEEDGKKVTKTIYVKCWSFKAPVNQNMNTLRKLEQERIAQSVQYDEQLKALKEQYLEKVKIFEQIRAILGYEKEGVTTKNAEDNDDEEDSGLSDGIGSEGGHDLSDDEDLLSDGATDRELDEPEADQTVDISVAKDLDEDTVMAE